MSRYTDAQLRHRAVPTSARKRALLEAALHAKALGGPLRPRVDALTAGLLEAQPRAKGSPAELAYRRGASAAHL